MDVHSDFRASLDKPKADFENLFDLDSQIKNYKVESNP